jgi:GNAT superfamily N-acetyltransferase
MAAISFPSGTIKNAWRGHRTVVLPEYQGLGLGVRLSDAVAEIMVQNGHRYFSKTAHPRMGEYRERSPLWRPTSTNKKDRQDLRHLDVDAGFSWMRKKHQDLKDRICYSHEYIGHIKSE